MSFPRYPTYKDSGVAWLGEVPQHWHVKRLRRVAELNPSRTEVPVSDRDREVSFLPMEAVGEDGVLTVDRTRPLGELETGYTYFSEGDVIIAKITPCFENGKGAVVRGLLGGFGFGTTELVVVRPNLRETTSEYLHLIFSSAPFRKLGEGAMYGAGGQKRVPDEFVRGFSIAFPPLPEQHAISAFLDRETAKIDALIAEQEQLIELLQEKRQAVISHAVTKGLGSNVPMVLSGVDWLGYIPRHWHVCSSRRMFAVRREPAQPGDKMLTASQKYGVLYQSEFVAREGRRVVEVILGVGGLLHVEPNDFIISMRSFQGGLEWSKLRGSTSFHYVMVRPMKNVHPPFFAYLFKCAPYIHALRATTDLIRDGQELRYSNFVQVDLPVIPIDEQREIAVYLDGEIRKIDALVDEASAAISLFRERRSALISAAVTGQIDARGLVEQEAA